MKLSRKMYFQLFWLILPHFQASSTLINWLKTAYRHELLKRRIQFILLSSVLIVPIKWASRRSIRLAKVQKIYINYAQTCLLPHSVCLTQSWSFEFEWYNYLMFQWKMHYEKKLIVYCIFTCLSFHW
jgi:hypothetical protein